MDKKNDSRNDLLMDMVIIGLFVVIGISYPPASPLFIIFILGAIVYLFSSNLVSDLLGLPLQFKNGLRLVAYGLSALAIIVFLFDLISQVKLF